jgi:hypothetical protein
MRSLLFKLRIVAGKYVHVGERDHWGTKGVRAAYRQIQLVNWQLFSANMTIAAMNRIAKLVGLAGARVSGEALACSLFAEGSRQGHFFGFAFFTADFIGERKKVEGRIKNSSLASGW